MSKRKSVSPAGNLLAEELVPVTRAGQFCPSRPDPSTVCRWALKGARGIKLESIRVGGKVMTSKEAVQRFLAACNARVPSQSEADAELQAAGL